METVYTYMYKEAGERGAASRFSVCVDWKGVAPLVLLDSLMVRVYIFLYASNKSFRLLFS